MWKQLISAIGMVVVMSVITGLAYPLAITLLAHAVMPFQAQGSLVIQNGKPVGSLLIGQNFNSPGYFHGRPSAAGSSGYDAVNSGGSNLGATNSKLVAAVKSNVAAVRAENGLPVATALPSDLVLASASGLDPDISPEAAYLQAARVAKYRQMDVIAVNELIAGHTAIRQLGILGEPRVNVLALNLALDAAKP